MPATDNPITANGDYDSGELDPRSRYRVRFYKDAGTATTTLKIVTVTDDGTYYDDIVGGGTTTSGNLDIVVEGGAQKLRQTVASASTLSARIYITKVD